MYTLRILSVYAVSTSDRHINPIIILLKKQMTSVMNRILRKQPELPEGER